MRKALVVLLCCLYSAFAFGNNYTVSFSGHLTSINDPGNLGGFSLGEAFAGSFFVDTSIAPDPYYSGPTANVYYLSGPTSFSMGSFTNNNLYSVLDINNQGPTSLQTYVYTTDSTWVQPGVYATQFGLSLGTPNGGALTGLSDDQTIDPALFTNNMFFIEGFDVASTNYQLLYQDFATVDNVTVTGVPEPASLLLLASGLVGVIAFRRKH